MKCQGFLSPGVLQARLSANLCTTAKLDTILNAQSFGGNISLVFLPNKHHVSIPSTSLVRYQVHHIYHCWPTQIHQAATEQTIYVYVRIGHTAQTISKSSCIGFVYHLHRES